MINIVKLPEKDEKDNLLIPDRCEWIHQAGDLISAVAITFVGSNIIHVYDGKSDTNLPIQVLTKFHVKPVVAVKYNGAFDVAISADKGGMMQYWCGPKHDYKIPDKKVCTIK